MKGWVDGGMEGWMEIFANKCFALAPTLTAPFLASGAEHLTPVLLFHIGTKCNEMKPFETYIEKMWYCVFRFGTIPAGSYCLPSIDQPDGQHRWLFSELAQDVTLCYKM